MIPNDFVQTLLGRVDIVEVIDRYVPLKKAGVNYAACCPFHSEKTPSFTVSPSKQFYHCFGCGAHGTAIGFLMEYAGRSFPDAVADLAREQGLEVPRDDRPDATERRGDFADIVDALDTAARHYRQRLREHPVAIAYLKERGLTGEVAARFGIGYAPDAWQTLAGVFDDYDAPLLEAAGLVIAGEAGKRYDRFRDRIMFPIHDSRGRVIGFGGRVLGAGEPKYLNSPETALFAKGRELYGLHLARTAIRTAGRVLVVEGYMDVVALAQHGIEYAVATLGTATTPTHAQKLLRATDNVVFCFDGDNAGRRAAWRALENTLPVLVDGKDARFLFLPEGEDPDDYVRRHGREGFESLLQTALPLSAYLLRELSAAHPPTTPEGRAALVAAAKPHLAALRAPVLAALIRRELATLAGLPDFELRELLPPAGPEPRRAPAASPARPPDREPRRALPTSGRRAPSLVRELIQGFLLQPEAARAAVLPPLADDGPEVAALTALVEACRATPGDIATAGLVQQFAGSTHEPVFARVLASAEANGVTPELAAAQLQAGLRRCWLRAQRSGLVAAVPENLEAAAGEEPSREETERLRQLELVRRLL